MIDRFRTDFNTVGSNSGGMLSLDEIRPLPENPAITQSLRNLFPVFFNVHDRV